ncbi:MAG: DEAD/DEAH box helicase, partial [Acidithiobacillus sp.]|uniref:DEAD/DEAH box helicase n=1 Tax=Acidithiobacillus sp. TaxID=1872118 RepID=UPI003CFD2061
EAREAIRAGKRRLILRAPTGAGKTIIASAVIQSAVERGSKVLFIAHRKELIDQASRKLDDFGIDHGVVMASHWRRRPHHPVQVASIQTLTRREIPEADLIIVDEAHLSLAKSYLDVLTKRPRAVVLGLTATPVRADGKPLSAVYHDIIHVSDVAQLIRMGFLVRPRHYAPERPDLTAIGVKGGDYDEAQLSVAVDRPDLVGNIVSHWRSIANGRTTAVFAVNIRHSQHIVAQFQAAGIRAEHVDGTTPKWQREQILKRFASGETTVVSNVGVFTEGYDNPRISAVVLARPTLSLALYIQMAGRGLRIDDGKRDCIVLDHAGCAHAHGFIDEEREWSLHTTKKKRGETKREAPVRTCDHCYAAYPAAARACPECGYEPERKPSEITEDTSHGLVEITDAMRAKMRRERIREEAKAQTLEDLQAIARQRGYSPGWAWHKWQARQRKHA